MGGNSIGQNMFSRVAASTLSAYLIGTFEPALFCILQIVTCLISLVLCWLAKCNLKAQAALNEEGQNCIFKRAERSTPATFSHMMEIVGQTPMLDTKLALRIGLSGTLSLKLEGFNPSGSVKDRSAEYMVRMAEQRGDLVPFSGQRVVESSSGNLAKALGFICAQRGYHFTAVCDEFSKYKASFAEVFGAKVHVVKLRLAPIRTRRANCA